MSSTILAIDQGTTSSRAIVFSREGQVLATYQRELKLFYPENGWVEQNPRDIWGDTLWAARSCLEKYPDISVIGITNQRETTVVWDRRTGEPVYNAIVWQDRRGTPLCRRLREQGYESAISAKTGLLLDPYFSATKLAWILDTVPGVRTRAENGELAFGTIDTWLLWNMTDGKVHATDATNASRTMLFDVVRQCWDDELLEIFRVPKSMLPEVRDSAADYGLTGLSVFDRQYLIGGIAGDQQAALVGQACFHPGMIKSTYGTGCFALMNIGGEFRSSRHRLLTTVAYRLRGVPVYAVEGSIFVAGAAIQWLRDQAGFFAHASESEAMAASVPDTDGVYFVPAFTGLGAPYWDPDARGAILGLTRETTKAHIARAALDAQAYQTLDLMDAMVRDGGADPAVIRADGGLVANALVCQGIADMTGKPIEIPANPETTALGAAFLAGLQVGLYKSLEDISAVWACAKRYSPSLTEDERQRRYAGWKRAIARVTEV